MFTFGKDKIKKKNRSRNFESEKNYFLLFFIFLNVNIFRGIFFLAVVDCSVKSPPVRGNRVFKEFLQYQTLLSAQLVALGNVFNHVLPSLLSGAFRGLAPLQTTDLDHVLPFFFAVKWNLVKKMRFGHAGCSVGGYWFFSST